MRDMQSMQPVAGCVFCARIDAGDYETTPEWNAVRFEPLNPIVDGHMLFVPDWHAEHPDATATGEAMAAGAWWAQDRGDFNLITSSGPAATQTVPHLHVHYVPRRPGDGLLLPWGGPR